MASAVDVYEAIRGCTGREDLARLGVAIFLHEKGPPGYEAGYGYTDRGPLPEWKGLRRQIEGVCSDLSRFFGDDRPVNPATLRAFHAQEWKASDPGWWEKVWTWYGRVRGMTGDALARTPIGRAGIGGEASRPPTLPPLPTLEDKLRGSLSPAVQERLGQGLSDSIRRSLALGLGLIGLVVLWNWIGGRR